MTDDLPHQQMRTEMQPANAGSAYGRYRVLRRLGGGGMGEVFLARDELLGREVALKVLLPEVVADPDRVARFQREARAIAALNHPNIVTIHDYGVDGGRHYFVTEYIAGATLREWMRGNAEPPEVMRIAAAIARALHAAHAVGIVHRDMKPENVVLTASGDVKVVDFGIAKLAPITKDTEGSTQAGMIVGTAPYMSPEQIRGEPLDGRSDIFSLGVILYEMIASRRPFSGGAMQETLAAILTAAPQPLLTRGMDPQLAALVMSMLSKERDLRPTATEIVRALDALIQPSPSALQRGEAESDSNLPAEPSPLAGREREIAEVVRLLQREDSRLVTITGAGGTGKTRLATRAARELLRTFSDGVWFVALEAVRDAALVPTAIAEVLQCADASEATLTKRLRGASMLLVLDNFEQVIDAASFVASLLRDTGSLKVLITSQAPLHIRAEREYPIDPLPVPGEQASIEEMRANPAAAMFIDRARSVAPDFDLTRENAAAVAKICRLLGGIPLAIELAAARVKMLSPDAIVARLADPLAFLTGGPRDLPDRQRALRSAIEWSCDLLTDEEKSAFAALSAFEGGWSSAAAQAVCGERTEQLLEALIDKNLIRRATTAYEQRFGMLDPIRRIASSKVSEVERLSLADRHLAYFADFAEKAEPHLIAAEQPQWLARLSADQANLRSALGHALQSDQTALGLQLATGSWRFWYARGLYDEGRRYLTGLRSASDGVDPHLLWKSWYAEGVLADAQGDYAAAYRAFSQQAAIAEAMGDAWAGASAMNNLAIAASRVGKLDEAADHHRRLTAKWQELGNVPAAALSAQNLGNVERSRGNFAEARASYERSTALFRELGDERGVAIALTCLADVDRDQGQLDTAMERYESALQTFIRFNDHWQVAKCLADYGRVCRLARRFGEAADLLAESALIFRETGDPKSGVDALEELALLRFDESRVTDGLRIAAAVAATRRALGIAPLLSTAAEPIVNDARAHDPDSWTAGSGMSFAEAVDSVQPL